MKLNRLYLAIATIALSVAGIVLADDEPAAPPRKYSSTPSSKAKIAEKRAAAAKIQHVDINSANKEELAKLPGLDDAMAEKIIAGRPYGSKAWLVSHKILSEDQFMQVKDIVEARQSKPKGAAKKTK